MAFNKITEEDLAGRGVLGLPDIPGLSTTEMQRKFEETSREVIIPKFNELVEKLNSPNFSEEIKTINPVTEEESFLQESLNDLHEETSEARNVAGVFKDIETVSNTVVDSEKEIPSSKAVVDYMKKLGAGDMQTSVYDKNGDGVVDNAEALGGIPAEEYALKSDIPDNPGGGGGDTGIDISFEDFENLEELEPNTNYYVSGAPEMNLGLSFFPDYTKPIREFKTRNDK